MQAFKLVSSSGIVIKRPQRPGPGVMAVFTTRAQGLLVFVVFLVTGQAVAWGVPVAPVRVAAFAFSDLMATGERET